MKQLVGFRLICSILLIPLAMSAEGPQWYFPKGGSWQPDEKVVLAIRATLEENVKKMAKHLGRDLKPWANYIFQIRGQEKDGKKYVYINALYDLPYLRLDTHELSDDLIVFQDGGSYFFNVKYDPICEAFYQLFINGEA